jgi:hypothetical protein
MTASTIACIRGCPVARRHLADCEHSDDGQCRGCLPRPADFGALCIACHYGLVRTLRDLPNARTLLAGHLIPGQGARSSDVIKRTKGDPPAPLNLPHLDLILQIDLSVQGWARIHAEEHQLTVPTDPIGHLVTHLASVECAEWIDAAWTELTDLLEHAHSLTPWRPETRRLVAPCPTCHCQALMVKGGEDHVTCKECGDVLDPARYARYEAALLEEHAQREVAA